MPATADLATAIQGAIAPALDNLIDLELERYLSGDELAAYVQNRIQVRLNGWLQQPAPKAETAKPPVKTAPKTAAKPAAKSAAKPTAAKTAAKSTPAATAATKRKPATRRKSA